jgi:hypothetical protein
MSSVTLLLRKRQIMVGNELDIILAALASGAALGFKDTTAMVVKDGYSAFRAILQHKLSKKPTIEKFLAEYEADPGISVEPLKKAIVEEQLDRDQEIIEAAKRLLALSSQQAIPEQFEVNNHGTIQGLNLGVFNSSITQNFGVASKDK